MTTLLLTNCCRPDIYSGGFRASTCHQPNNQIKFKFPKIFIYIYIFPQSQQSLLFGIGLTYSRLISVFSRLIGPDMEETTKNE